MSNTIKLRLIDKSMRQKIIDAQTILAFSLLEDNNNVKLDPQLKTPSVTTELRILEKVYQSRSTKYPRTLTTQKEASDTLFKNLFDYSLVYAYLDIKFNRNNKAHNYHSFDVKKTLQKIADTYGFIPEARVFIVHETEKGENVYPNIQNIVPQEFRLWILQYIEEFGDIPDINIFDIDWTKWENFVSHYSFEEQKGIMMAHQDLGLNIHCLFETNSVNTEEIDLFIGAL